jgi:hypothetical protein
MKRRTARVAPLLPVFAVLLPLAAGCGLREKLRGLAGKPTPKPLPTATPLPVPQLKMDFVRIREERARGEAGRSTCEIDVELAGTRRSEVEAARIVVARAVDDLGTPLVPDGAAAAKLEPVQGGDLNAPLVLALPLKPAPRKAKLLLDVSGEIELYVPNVDPEALVAVPDFRSLSGRTVVSPALAASGAVVAFATAQEAEALPAGPDDVVLRVSDPKGRIEGFYLVDPEGTAWKTNRETRGGLVVLSSQAEPPGPGWGLQVRLLTPNTLRRYRFALKDVPLP